ncbi:arsenate reductase [Pedobacter sp. UYEF25]
MVLFGIPNCNSVKKAKHFLNENNIEYQFHDFKKNGIDVLKLNQWCNVFGWEKVLNRKGTTVKRLSAEEQALINNQEQAVEFMKVMTSAIKRPILEKDGAAVLISFDEEQYRQLFGL